jgi:hypothetical protein
MIAPGGSEVRSVVGLVLAVATLLPTGVSAASVTFASSSQFREAVAAMGGVAPPVIEGWDTFPAWTIFPDGTTANGITYGVSAGDAFVVPTGISTTPPHNLYITDPPLFRPLVDTFHFGYVKPVRAFAITFSSTFANRPGDYYARTDTGELALSSFFPVWPGATIGQFVGLIADRPFSSVTIGSSANAYYGMDDLTFVPIPLPGGGPLLAGALGLLFWVAATASVRRRRTG